MERLFIENIKFIIGRGAGMNRNEFLRQLERLLCDIPENERREAIEYYQNYFEDAGPEKEAQIIEELGSPQEVAASIKRNLFGEDYEDYDFVKEKKQQNAYENQQNKTTRNIVLAVIIVLTFPLWIGILASAFGILIAGIAVVFAAAVSIIAVVFCFFVMGFVLCGIGMVNLFTGFPAVGLVLTAVGMFLLAFAVLGLIVVVWTVGRILPWTLRAVVRLCKKPFQKRGAVI
jgi:uncharacterized membrane protein